MAGLDRPVFSKSGPLGSSVDQAIWLYIIGAIWLAFFIGSEAYVRKFIEPNTNMMRLVKILGIEIAVLITIYLAYLMVI